MNSLKAQILALATAVALEKVEVAGLDSPIYVKKLSVSECAGIADLGSQDEDEKGKGKKGKGKKDTGLANAFVLLSCDDKGEPLFSLDEVSEVEKLPFDLVNQVVSKGLAFNGMLEKDKVDTLEKNS